VVRDAEPGVLMPRRWKWPAHRLAWVRGASGCQVSIITVTKSPLLFGLSSNVGTPVSSRRGSAVLRWAPTSRRLPLSWARSLQVAVEDFRVDRDRHRILILLKVGGCQRQAMPPIYRMLQIPVVAAPAAHRGCHPSLHICNIIRWAVNPLPGKSFSPSIQRPMARSMSVDLTPGVANKAAEVKRSAAAAHAEVTRHTPTSWCPTPLSPTTTNQHGEETN